VTELLAAWELVPASAIAEAIEVLSTEPLAIEADLAAIAAVPAPRRDDRDPRSEVLVGAAPLACRSAVGHACGASRRCGAACD
jgi:hypothetical protein